MPFGSTAQHIGKLVYWHIIKNNFLICNVDYTFISFYLLLCTSKENTGSVNRPVVYLIFGVL